jgi:hypothetical protein
MSDSSVREVGVTPQLELLYCSEIEIAAPLAVGNARYGERRVINITGGRFEGPRLRGTVLAGGADWQFTRHDGVVELEAHYTLQTDDGALIYLRNPGLRRASSEVNARLLAGEQVSPEHYYFRTTPIYECGDSEYRWLNSLVAVGVGEREADRVLLTVYVVT